MCGQHRSSGFGRSSVQSERTFEGPADEHVPQELAFRFAPPAPEGEYERNEFRRERGERCAAGEGVRVALEHPGSNLRPPSGGAGTK